MDHPHDFYSPPPHYEEEYQPWPAETAPIQKHAGAACPPPPPPPPDPAYERPHPQSQSPQEEQDPNNDNDGTDDDSSDEEEEQTKAAPTKRKKREYRPPKPYVQFHGRKQVREAEQRCEEARLAVVQAEEALKAAQLALEAAKETHEQRKKEVYRVNEEMVDEILKVECRRKWTKSFQKLKDFHAKHGHCICKVGCKDRNPNNPAWDAVQQGGESKAHVMELNGWILHQRNDRRKGKLHLWRQIALDRLGFVWEEKNYEWEQMFKELQEHKAIHGTCRVKAPRDKGSRRLYRWVWKQHRNYKRYKESGFKEPTEINTDEMTKKRCEMLEGLGVDWEEGIGYQGKVKRFDAAARKRKQIEASAESTATGKDTHQNLTSTENPRQSKQNSEDATDNNHQAKKRKTNSPERGAKSATAKQANSKKSGPKTYFL